jgi:hypothetical protein
MESMRWSEVTSQTSGNDASNNNNQGAPTIKNHSVTHFANYLYCFGGYDGRRNHMTLLLYSILEQKWVRPHHVGNAVAENEDETMGGAAAGGGDAAMMENADNGDIMNNMQQEQDFQLQPAGDGMAVQPAQVQPFFPPFHQNDYLAGDRSILVSGNPPPGRNGHSATLAKDPDDEDNARIIIVGGWLGTGPLAASDMHVLDISNAGRRLRWYQPPVKGTPPGPCNMHSADYVSARKEVYVFRGGNGREYLNDLHALNVTTMVWRRVETTGEIPQQRANHSSAILEETGELFIFGGWNGTERLNDIHILDTETSNWTRPRAGGTLPHPRAGMTLTALRGRLYLFGGSGTSSKCFQDLQILDRESMSWLDVTQFEPILHGRNRVGSNSYDNHYQPNGFRRQQDPPYAPQYHAQQPLHHIIEQSSSQDGQYQPQYSFADYEGGHQSGTEPMDVGYDANRTGSFTASRADWRSRELAAHARAGASLHSPNPNDEDTVPTVMIHGRGPGRRAGHTATAVNRKIYVFGGSCGADYLNDFYVLDTDPPPTAVVREPTSLNLIERRLGHFFNDEEFSDVTFIVQGRKVYGHKMILSIVSECFRAMFTAGFRESSSSEIEITECSYDAFVAVMEYIYTVRYTGVHKSMSGLPTNGNGSITPDHLGRAVEILGLADRFFLDHLKEVCETELQPCVNADTVEYLLQVAQKANAMQLLSICEHFIRNRDTLSISN